ncbi:C45 family autoproteolytic acyltransferase/hydolase [Pseudonocardia kunmingensis]|uniref:Isopenicillin-N N-acyltransferase-like protein n=1 Tax=Pseudonocardia kunmingensis TaxID=630975 RepID=A0A543DK33_9PSEU|nr:C45 family peptidase [Pseudonocardia kunmingensis]TQM09686.1 isopenicillin-N N-acyltransferase-like protein [Pseudonocardia kunmingensis]
MLDAELPAGPPRLVVAEGDSRTIGGAVGEQTATMVQHSLASYERRFRDDAGLSAADVNRWGGIYLDVAGEYDSRIRDMLVGLAEAVDVAPERIAALNARTEMLYGTGYREGGCTAAAVLPEVTADGHTLLGQNWDWRTEQARSTFVLATRDDEGHTTIALTEAGMFAKSGMNGAGLGVCANLLVSGDDRGGRGVPYHFLLRGALEARRMSQAHRKLLPVPRISSGNVLLADAGGEAIDFELAPDTFGVLHPEDGLITHANHFESGIDVVDRRRASSALTLIRARRARRLLARRSGAITPATLAEVFRDRYSWPDSICRYPDPDLPPQERFATLFSIVMDLDDQVFWIAPFPVDEQPFYRWSLREVFGGAPEPRVEFPPVQEVTP